MRKSRVLFAALLALLAAGFAVVYGVFWQKTGQVELAETVLFGDAAAAGNLSITLHSTCGQKLYWDTSVTPGSPAQNEFEARLSVKNPNGKHPEAHLDSWISWNRGSYGLTTYFGDAEFGALYQKVAENTPAGESRTQLLDIADYCTHYPVAFEMGCQQGGRWTELHWDIFPKSEHENDTHPFLQALAGYFTFPITENVPLRVTIAKDEKGRIVSAEVEPAGDGEPSVLASSAYGAGYLYFIVDAAASDGSPLDYGQVPGGRSLYRLDLTKEKEPAIEDLEVVLPLESREIQQLLADGTGSQILLETGNGREHEVQVLDAKNAKILQTLPLENADSVGLIPGEGFLLAMAYSKENSGSDEASLTLYLPDEAGRWQRQYTVSLEQEFGFSERGMNEWFISPDGKKLAEVFRLEPAADLGPAKYLEGCSVGIRVLDETGWLYAARFDSSLDKARVSEKDYDGSYQQLCRMDRKSPKQLEVNWT